MVPGSVQPFRLNASFPRFFLLEQIQGHVAHNGHVLSRMTLTKATIIFPKRHIEYPMQ